MVGNPLKSPKRAKRTYILTISCYFDLGKKVLNLKLIILKLFFYTNICNSNFVEVSDLDVHFYGKCIFIT